MHGRLCNILYQTWRCWNGVTEYIINEAQGKFSNVEYIIYDTPTIYLKLFHQDEMLNTTFFSYKGKVLPVHAMKVYKRKET
jgi:hypothetical protein